MSSRLVLGAPVGRPPPGGDAEGGLGDVEPEPGHHVLTHVLFKAIDQGQRFLPSPSFLPFFPLGSAI